MRMLRLLGLLLVAALPLSAQVTVEVVSPQGQFLPDEKMLMAVKITNRSGQPLQFGDDNAWLSFSVLSQEGRSVERAADPEVKGPFTLESGEVATRRVDLAPAFRLVNPGHYKVTATVQVKEWGKAFTTLPAEFDLINALNLREVEFGIPGAPGQPPEVRRYALQQAHFSKRMELYVRVTETSNGRTLKISPLGVMISFSEPELQVDRTGNLHVLWQNGARSFAYRVVNPSGEVTVRQTHEFIGSRPKLGMAEDGAIGVQGGMRRPALDDFPSEAPKVSQAAPATSAPPVDSVQK